MNDAQKDVMLTVLGDAFDRAAVTEATKRGAALRIVRSLQNAGYAIVMRGSTENRKRKASLHVGREVQL